MYKGAVGIVLVRALGTEQRKCKKCAELLLTVRLTILLPEKLCKARKDGLEGKRYYTQLSNLA